MSAHTPGPWFQGQIKGTEHQIFTGEVGVFIDDAEANPADIAFIVRACNSHEAMLEALKDCLHNAKMRRESGFECGPTIEREIERTELAIRLAEGRA